MAGTNIKRLVAIFDPHYPYTIPAFFDRRYPKKETAFFKFLADFDPHILIDGGDMMDLDCITHWNRGKPKLMEGKRLFQTYQEVNQFLSIRQKYLKSVQQMYYIEGNHENWVEQLIETDPNTLEGHIEIPKNLALKERGIQWIEHRHSVKVGKNYFIHGDYSDNRPPKNHAQTILALYQRNIVYGHFHTEQMAVSVTPLDEQPHKAQSIGTMGTLNPAWLRNAPNSWVNSFYVSYIMSDGTFYDQTVRVIDDKFVFGGQLYK